LTVNTEFFDAVAIRHLDLLNESGVALLYTARKHFHLRGGVWVDLEGAGCIVLTHCAGAERIGTLGAKDLSFIFFGYTHDRLRE
jgi:hypothetical protein